MHDLVSFSAAVFSDSLMSEDLGIVLHSSHEHSSDLGSTNPSRTTYWDTDPSSSFSMKFPHFLEESHPLIYTEMKRIKILGDFTVKVLI